MTGLSYSLLNGFLAVLACAALGLFVRSAAQLRTVAQISLVITILGFPWAFFGIRLGAWAHSNPGPTIASVPINEVILGFLISVITSSILTRHSSAILREARRVSKAKKSPQDGAQGNPSSSSASELERFDS